MLKGFYREGDLLVSLEGYDLADSMAFYMSCPLNDTKRALDKGITISDDEGGLFYSPNWEQLYLGIGTASINVSCFTVNENGVVYKNEINSKFFQNLGSLIRGMKMSCYTANREDELEALSMEFNPKKVLKYIIPDSQGSIRGKVELEMCNVVKMEVGTKEDHIQLYLEEDYSYGLKVNKITNRHHRIPLDLSEYIVEREDNGWDLGNEDSLFSLQDIIEKKQKKIIRE